MARLVAIDLPGGEPFTRALEAVWGGGDAAFVVDRRLTGSARRDLLALARPHRVIGGGDGQAPDPTALPLTSGDALVVACGEGALRIRVLQREGGKAITAADYLNSRRDLSA